MTKAINTEFAIIRDTFMKYDNYFTADEANEVIDSILAVSDENLTAAFAVVAKATYNGAEYAMSVDLAEDFGILARTL